MDDRRVRFRLVCDEGSVIFDEKYKVCNKCLLIFRRMMRDTQPRTRILIKIRIRILIKFILNIQDSYYIDIKINLMAGVIISSFLPTAGVEV